MTTAGSGLSLRLSAAVLPMRRSTAITKIDEWFIDKIAILVEMEQALKTQELTVDLLKEAKRLEFPDNVIARLTGKT